MSDWLEFEGQIVAMPWGDKVYTVLPLPPEVDAALEAAGAVRVEGEIAEHPVNLAPSKAPVLEGRFLWTGKTLLSAIGIEPGDRFEVRLRPALGDEVPVPDDVAAAFRAAGLTTVWEGLTPGKRRGHLYQIETAKRTATRAKRIAKLCVDLRGLGAG